MNKELKALQAIVDLHNQMKSIITKNMEYHESDDGFVNEMMRKIDISRLNIINLAIQLTNETIRMYGINLDGENGKS